MRQLNRLVLLLPSVAVASTLPGQTAHAGDRALTTPCLAQRLDASGDDVAGRFGHSIAREGDCVVVGRPLDEERGVNAGALFVYRHDTDLGWAMEQKLTADDGEANDLLGLVFEPDYSSPGAVAISGDFLMAGAPGDDDNASNAGAVYVFQRQKGGWVQVQKLLAPEGSSNDRLSAVALEGNVAVVGAPNLQGYALVYRYDGSTWSYAQDLDFTPVSDFDTFGWVIDIRDDIIAVGANGYDNFSGAVFLYEYDEETERWELQQRLDAPRPSGNPQFGSSLDLGGDPPRLIVGSPFEQPGPRGGAYVYEHDGTQWELEQWLLATDCTPEIGPCLFGQGVGIVSDPVWRVVVTTTRFAAYEFQLDEFSLWCKTRHWQPPLAEADRQPIVALQGESALLGTPRGGADGDQGRVYVWDLAEDCVCPEDLDGSGDVGFGDILSILTAWGPCGGECPEDLDGNGEVGFGDILVVLTAWGPCT